MSNKLYSEPLTTAQVIMMSLSKFHDQFQGSWVQKLLYIIRRIMFMARSWFFDIEYHTIPEWLLQKALEDWKKNVLDRLEYIGEVFDCDDFARHFAVWLKDYIMGMGIINNFAPPNMQVKVFNGVGLGLGVLSKNGKVLGGHAWNIVLITNSNGKPELVYVEPQIGDYFRGSVSPDGFTYTLQAVII